MSGSSGCVEAAEVVQNAFTFMVFVSGGGGLGCDMVGYALAKGM